MIGQLAPALGQVGRRHVAHVLDNPLLPEDSDIPYRDGAARRVPGVCVSMREFTTLVERVYDVVGDHDAADRQIPGGHSLGHRHEIGFHAVQIGAEPVAGPSEAADHLIHHEQDLTPVQDTADLGPVGLGRDNDPAGALDGLGDECGDAILADLVDLRRQGSRRLDAVFLW